LPNLPILYDLSERIPHIKGHDERFGIYRLGFPNREVEEGFIRFLLPYYANVNKVESPFEILKFVREVRAGDYDPRDRIGRFGNSTLTLPSTAYARLFTPQTL